MLIVSPCVWAMKKERVQLLAPAQVVANVKNQSLPRENIDSMITNNTNGDLSIIFSHLYYPKVTRTLYLQKNHTNKDQLDLPFWSKDQTKTIYNVEAVIMIPKYLLWSQPIAKLLIEKSIDRKNQKTSIDVSLFSVDPGNDAEQKVSHEFALNTLGTLSITLLDPLLEQSVVEIYY